MLSCCLWPDTWSYHFWCRNREQTAEIFLSKWPTTIPVLVCYICVWKQSSHLRRILGHQSRNSCTAVIPGYHWLLLFAGYVELNPGLQHCPPCTSHTNSTKKSQQSATATVPEKLNCLESSECQRFAVQEGQSATPPAEVYKCSCAWTKWDLIQW